MRVWVCGCVGVLPGECAVCGCNGSEAGGRRVARGGGRSGRTERVESSGCESTPPERSDTDGSSSRNGNGGCGVVFCFAHSSVEQDECQKNRVKMQ